MGRSMLLFSYSNNVKLTSQQISNITNFFPNLTTLVASKNLYPHLPPFDLTSSITEIILEDNDFTSLSDLRALTSLPSLRRLILKSNKVFTITSPSSPPPVFPSSLADVDLSYNEIETWTFINQLPRCFPGLTSLRISHNPLFQSLQAADGQALRAEDGYMLTLARLSKIKVLDYSPITEKERLNAESYYLSLIAKELSFGKKEDEDTILKDHPRYNELCEEYGQPTITRVDNKVNPNSLAARLINITFHLHQSPRQADKTVAPKFSAEIPKSFTAYTLLGTASKGFHVPPRKCKMVWETGEWIRAPRTGDGLVDEWYSESSESEEEEEGGKDKKDEDPRSKGMIMREVEIVPGTRAVGNWIEGTDALVRVELL
jgi:tubulin-specific chaperone E